MQHKNLKRLLTSLSAAVVIAGILMMVGPTAFGEKGHLDLRPPHPAVDIREEAPTGLGPTITAPHSPTAATIYVRPGGDDTLCDGTVDADYASGIAPSCAVKTIQKSIDLVDSAGTVRIAAGTYTENIRANKPVELAGAGEALTVVIPAVSLPNPCVGSSLCGSATAASNIILVEASNVKIHDITLDGDNPGLTSGIVRDGADLDARNGIIENLYAGVFNNLEIYNVTVKNIYLRGVYFSSGGNNFTVHDSAVQNVQGDGYSIAIFNFGGSGTIANNAVSAANDAIAANHSRGTQFLANTITGSGSGVHTDNAGDGGGTADLIQDNSVSNCSTNGYGVWVFVPYLAPTVNRNTVTNCAVGLSAWGQGAAVTTSFTNNVVNGPAMAANSVGVYITTDLISYGYTDVSVDFRNNVITGNDAGIYLTADPQGWNPEPYVAKTVLALFYDNSIQGNTTQMGLGTQGTYLPNATANWWGSNSPGAVKIAANNGSLVDYTPWLANGSDTSPNPGFQGDFATLWVDDDSPQTGSVGRIQEGINLVSGSTVNVAAGAYDEDVNLNKALSLLGAGAGSTTIRGIIGGDSATLRVSASSVTIAGFTVTRLGNNTTDWNNPGLNSAGIAVQGAFTGMVVRDNTLTGNRTAIDVNNSSGHTIRNNVITFNRTGLIFRNQTDTMTLVENEITDNWTVGILFLDGSGGTNSPPQSALNATFSNNNLSGNWYGQIVDRQSGGSIPAPGTTNLKNFSGNWLGTTAPVVTVANSTEPGYAAQIPVAYGGTATPPGGQPDIAGPASANFDFTPYLNSGMDTNVETTPTRGTYGFQGDFSNLWVTAAGAQTGVVGRIQEGINLVSGSTVHVAAGTYVEAGILINSAVALLGAGSGPSGAIIDATSLATTGNVITINTTAGNVTLDGFRILTGQNLNGIYAKATSAASTVTITNNHIEGWKTSANPTRVCSGDNFDLIAGYGSQANLVFQTNELLQGCSNAILLERWLGPTDVSYNSWDRGVKDAATDGYFNMNYGGPDITTLQKVSHNTIDLGGGTLFTNNERSTGVTFAAAYTGAQGGYTQVVITDNTITNLRPYRRGIGLWNNAPNPGTGGDIANAVISGNTITGMPGNTGSIGIRLLGLVSNTTVSGNTINNVDMVFRGQAWNSHIATGAAVNQNNFSNSATGFDWQGATLLNAETNWWGSPCGPSGAGPGNGIPVSTNVDFSPWWTTVNGPGTASYAGGEYIVPTGSTTPQIQAILDCAGPGSVVKFESGSYPGGLVVNNSAVTLKLNGCTIGHGSPAFTIIGNDVTISGPGVLDGNGEASPGILVQNAGNFTLQNAEVREWLDGIQVTGDVVSLKVTGNWIHANTDAGLQVDGTPGGVITIKGNLFKENTGDGVLYAGTGLLTAVYNSWGDMGGPNVGAGDGANAAKINFTPWTFTELFMDVNPPANAVTRNVVETTSFNVELKADAVRLYGMAFKITYDPAKLTLNSTTFASPWAGACASLSAAPGIIRYRCNLQAPTPEYSVVGGTIATFNFTAAAGPPGNGPWPTYFDISRLETDTSAAALGGVKVFVNNAGFGAPSVPARAIDDTNDGEIIIVGLANFNGFVDLEGNNNEGGATLTVYNQKPKSGAIALANGTSAASGAYTTSYINPNWLLVGTTYWLQFDAPLHLPTTTMVGSVTYPAIPTDWTNGALLTTRPTTPLAFAKLLGGDATNNDVIDIFDAGCIGGEYENPSFSTCGDVPGTSPDVVVDGVVNIFDLVLMGSNYERLIAPGRRSCRPDLW